MCLVGR